MRLEADPAQGDRDRVGRILRHVWRDDGLFVKLEVLKGGHAREYSNHGAAQPYQRQPELKVAEAAARQERLGRWVCASICSATWPAAVTLGASRGDRARSAWSRREESAVNTGAVGRVLVVEDELQVAAVIRDTLREAGYDVVVEADGAAGLAVRAVPQPDGTVVDLVRPPLAGWITIAENTRSVPD